MRTCTCIFLTGELFLEMYMSKHCNSIHMPCKFQTPQPKQLTDDVWCWEQNWRVPCSHWKNKFMMRCKRGLWKSIQAAHPAALYGEQQNKSLLIRWFTCNGQLHHDDWSSNPLSWQRCLFCVSVSVKLMHEWALHVCCAYLQEHMTGHGFSKVIERVYVHKSKRKKRQYHPSTLCQR